MPNLKPSRAWLRSRLVPVALVAVATALTVPWTFWVIKTAYNQHINENAKALARRVELRVSVVPTAQLSSQQASEALQTELNTDTTVQLASFCDMSDLSKPFYVIGWVRNTGDGSMPRWTKDELKSRARGKNGTGELIREEAGGRVDITVPWVRGNRALGFTYLEFSRDALSRNFWEKEAPLLRRVIGLTAAAIAFLSALGILASHALMKVGRVEQRAELARQGLLAERGLTAAVLAHEIRNPLAALRFQLHSLRRNAAEPARVAHTADTIDAELSRIQQLVTDYLEHERARTQPVQGVDLADAAGKLQTLMGELLRESDTELTVATPAEPVVVTCDPHALRQILMNLVLNAQQAMQHERGRTKDRGAPAAEPGAPGDESSPRPAGRDAITLTVGRADGFGSIDVADNGPGIPPEMRERLFKPFQTSRKEGTGIGLALVKRFVDNFGGSVAVESGAGCGTTFRLRLPLAGENEASLAGASAAIETHGSSEPPETTERAVAADPRR